MSNRQPGDFNFETLEKIDLRPSSTMLDNLGFRVLTVDQFNKLKDFLTDLKTEVNELKKLVKEKPKAKK